MDCHNRRSEEIHDAVGDKSKPTKVALKIFGDVDVSHLREHADCAEQAFDLMARLATYWKSIVLRLVDGLALHILRGIKWLVENDLEEEHAEEVLGNNRNQA
jgi:hypothetical protein